MKNKEICYEPKRLSDVMEKVSDAHGVKIHYDLKEFAEAIKKI